MRVVLITCYSILPTEFGVLDPVFILALHFCSGFSYKPPYFGRITLSPISGVGLYHRAILMSILFVNCNLTKVIATQQN